MSGECLKCEENKQCDKCWMKCYVQFFHERCEMCYHKFIETDSNNTSRRRSEIAEQNNLRYCEKCYDRYINRIIFSCL